MLMICDCLCRGEARYYLTSRSGFRVSGAPSNNKALEEKTPTTAIEKCPIEKTATAPIEKHPIEGVSEVLDWKSCTGPEAMAAAEKRLPT
ncbi:hypothetical protein GW17_00032160 [Ensete ventricosum]|nr:hypothetical protein GW17_00032160 [Ensete ventricosum]